MGRLRELRQIINEWLRVNELGKRVYPREVGLKRRVVEDEVDLYGYLNENKWTDCYSAIFSNWQIVNREFDTIYLDIDCHDCVDFDEMFEKSYEKLCIVKEKIDVSRAYWTGRGFACYIDFDLTHIENYGVAVRKLIEEKSLFEYVDRQVTGDIRRVARIPSTVNSKSGLKCVKIDVEASKDEILNSVKKGEHMEYDVVKNNDVVDILKKYDCKDGKEKKVELKKCNLDVLPDCIKRGILKLAEHGELEHSWRVVIAIFLLKTWGYERTKKLFELFASDYDERKTEYQLKYIGNKGYKCYSCKKLKLMGICEYDDLKECAFYILTDGWLERMGDIDVNEQSSEQV